MESLITVSDTIDKMLYTRTVGEWEFLYIHTNMLFRSRMTTDRIGKSYEYKLSERKVSENSPRLKALSKALRSANLSPGTNSLDVRYAFTIRDNRSKDIVTLYMDFSHQSILINNVLYKANNELANWFKDLAREVTKIE